MWDQRIKVIFKDVILDLMTWKNIWGWWKILIKFPMLWWRSYGTPGCIEENIECSKKNGLKSREERVGMMALRLLCFPQQHSMSMGELLKTPFFCPLEYIINSASKTDPITPGKAHPALAPTAPKEYRNTGEFREKPKKRW